jgi:hypothetical protein
MEQNAARIIELYLDYLNNYLTVERFAEAYSMTVGAAKELVEVGRYIGHFDEASLRTHAGDR